MTNPKAQSPLGDAAALSDAAVERLRRAAAGDAAPPPGEGDLIGDRFELLERIGAGGSGVVFRALDRETGLEVALKAVFWKEAWDDGRFAREAAALAALEHPAIVRYIAHGQLAGGAGYLVTELLTGRTLAARLRDGELGVDESLELATRVARGLGVVHERGIVHRDIKPSNVFVCDDDLARVKIIDFGVARREGQSDLTRTGAIVGTPGYLAPEQARGPEGVGPATDVFALGCVLFRCLTGRSPFEGTDVLAVALRTVLDEAPRVSSVRAGVSGALDRLVAAMLAKVPASRPRSGRDLAGRIERVRRIQARPHSLRPPRSRATRPAVWVLAGTVLLGGGALVVRSVVHGAEPGPARSQAAVAATNAVIAVLPFQDETNEPRLDFSSAGLAYLVGSELRGLPETTTVGYYRLARDVGAPDAGLASWVEAARGAGATLLLRGRLRRGREGIETTLVLERLDGVEAARAARVSDVEGVPDAVRASVGEIAKSLGAPAAPRGRRAVALTVERATQLAVAQIEQYRLDAARVHLDEALRADPNAAEAHYWLAVVSWWEHREQNALRSIDLALAGDLDEPRRGFLDGLRSLIGRDPAAAMVKFAQLSAKYPDDRDILYGLSEACFHGGEPERGAATYRTLVASWPRFRLGLFHVFDWYRARGDAEGLAWVLGLRDDPDRVFWAARAKIALRDHDGALELYASQVEGRAAAGGSDWEAKREIIGAHAVAGHLALAAALAEELRGRHHTYGAAALHGLAAVRGLRAEEARWAEQLLRDARSLPTGEERFEIVAPLALIALADGADLAPLAGELAEALRGSYVEWGDRASATSLTLAGFRGDAESVARLRQKSVLARSAAVALDAELGGRHREAAQAWTHAAELAAWGDLTTTYRFLAARALRAAKGHEDVLAACAEVVQPRLFSWVWAAMVGPCLLWQAEAARALGRDEIAVPFRPKTGP